ncbi:MAG TPA: glycosyltransferase [Thermoanaerobaculales bacterium]|nr:glycosyltransferase [Thermoanaerobaculales bacterium]
MPPASAGAVTDAPVCPGPRRHLLTIVLEDYFHVAPLKSVVEKEHWYRFERRFEDNTRRTLDLLDEFDAKATFFVLGCIADEMPELIRAVVDRGHEVASKGYAHRSIDQLSSEEFREDLLRSRDALERASGRAVHGYRIAHRWFGPRDLWALDVLAEEGFRYDSSVCALFHRYAGEPWRRAPHVHSAPAGEIREFPLPAFTVGGWSLPIAGGNYARQFPHWLMRRLVAAWMRAHAQPFLFYFHVWELDPDQPRIQAAPLRERIRQYRNLDKMGDIIRYYLGSYRFTGIADHLGLPIDSAIPVRERRATSAPLHVAGSHAERARAERDPVSVVVPCFNEELILPYLANTLENLERSLGAAYDFRYIFVDDGSADGTLPALEKIFGNRPGCTLLRHGTNRGVAAAILTGIRAADTDVVCSIDCDCTYDPLQLASLIPLLEDGVDMVTASPYHAEGEVRNVPGWRLFLSKSLSRLYRVVLHHRLATYTSCFRVYRRDAVADVEVREGGFLGVAELLGRLDLKGGRIIECPAVLEVRLLGRSKMKTLRTILGHLRLLARLSAARLFKRRPAPSSGL